MTMDIEAIKAANKIEDVIEETSGLTLRGRGKYWKPDGEEGSSLVVNVNDQLYNWNAKGHAGDAITWLENTEGMDFRQAVEWLARRAGIDVRWDPKQAQAWQAARARRDTLTTIAEHLQVKLTRTSAALEWAEGRGWTQETLKAEGCGYWDGDKQGLAEHLKLHEIEVGRDIVQAMMQMPPQMFVYVHHMAGRCDYLTGRSIEGKKHWNLPAKLAGGRQPYWNHVAHGRAPHVVVVEGQADAVTLAQWTIPAVALAGTSPSPPLLRRLSQLERVFVALDRDEGGQAGAEKLARQLGPLTRIVQWPAAEAVHDANDWLQAGGTEEECRQLLGAADNYAVHLCRRAAAADAMAREPAAEEALGALAALPEYAYEKARHSCAELLDLGVTRLDRVVRRRRKVAQEREKRRTAVKERKTSPGDYVDGHLFEMIYEPEERRTAYVVRTPDGQIEERPVLELDDVIYEPLSPHESMLEKFQVRFSSGIDDHMGEEVLYHQMRSFVHKYLEVPETFEKICCFYAMMTWRFDQFNIVPYLRFLGQTGSGKSRGLKVVGALAFRPMRLVAVTPASIFHAIDTYGKLTMLFEEMDLGHADHTAEILQIINAGYAKENAVPRVVKGQDGNFGLKAYEIFGPKIFAQRKPFSDAATNSRCLTQEMNSIHPREDIDRYIDDPVFWRHAEGLRNQLLHYRMVSWQPEIEIDRLTGYELPARLQEIMVSLKSVIVSEELHAELESFMEEMYEQSVAEWAMTLEARVVEALLVSYYRPSKTAKEKATAHGKELLLQLKIVTKRLNDILDRDNEVEREPGDTKGMISSRKVGSIVRRDLNLHTKQHSHHRTWYVEWDAKRMGTLATRYGLAQLHKELHETPPEEDEDVGQQKRIDLL